MVVNYLFYSLIRYKLGAVTLVVVEAIAVGDAVESADAAVVAGILYT